MNISYLILFNVILVSLLCQIAFGYFTFPHRTTAMRRPSSHWSQSSIGVKRNNIHHISTMRLLSTALTGEISELPKNFKTGRVAVLGNPNVGKSSIVNALVQHPLCIVSPKPQTTRHKISAILNGDNYQMIFVDTPGMLNQTQYELHDMMMKQVNAASVTGDIMMVMTDIYGNHISSDRIFRRMLWWDGPIYVVINKLDVLLKHNYRNQEDYYFPALKSSPEELFAMRERITIERNEFSKEAYRRRIPIEDIDKGVKYPIDQVVELWRQRLPQANIVLVSAHKDWNLEFLKQKLISHLPEGPRYFDDVLSDRPERFFASEIIRESVFYCFGKEIPYNCEVQITSFQDKNDGLTVIQASIITGRDSLKSILIGEGGSKIKQVGTKARIRLEEFLQRQVYLDLKVKVMKDWRSNPMLLKKFGYDTS